MKRRIRQVSYKVDSQLPGINQELIKVNFNRQRKIGKAKVSSVRTLLEEAHCRITLLQQSATARDVGFSKFITEVKFNLVLV